MVSFRIDRFDLSAVQGTLKSLLSTIVLKHQFLVLSHLYDPALTSIHDYWKNYSFDCMDICYQRDVSAFSYAV